jgi:hypothetical protein
VPMVSNMASARLLTRPGLASFYLSKPEFWGIKSLAMQTVLRAGALDLRPAPPLGVALVGLGRYFFWLRLSL